MAVILLLVCAVTPADAATAGKIDILGLHTIEKEEMLDMLAFREGAPIDAELVRLGIKRAFRKGIFDDISVHVSDSEPAVVTVEVKEKDMVRKIVVEGDYPLSARKIRELFLLKEDAVMRHDLIDQAAEKLRGDLLLLGYPGAKISVSSSVSEKMHHNITLTVTIEAGLPLLVREVKIIDTDSISGHDLKISSGDRYDQIKIRNELQRIKELLKKEGYYKPLVGPYSYDAGILSISVKPGKKLTTAIEGNSVISTKLLGKEMPFFETEMFNDEAVDETVIRMLSLYHKEGYPAVQIAPVVRSDDQHIQVTFFIHEGRKIQVRSIQFKGALLSGKILGSVLELREGQPYNPDLRSRDRETLREYYTALGFLDVSISEFEPVIDEKTGYADISVEINEGRQTVFGSFEIKGVSEDRKKKLLAVIGLNEGNPYNELDISDARFRILDQYVGEGFANIDVFVDRSLSSHKADIIFTISEGSKKTIGKTVIVGNERTRYRVIKREVAAHEGAPYSFAAVARERQRLYKLGLFTDVEIEPTEVFGDKKDLLVRVREGNAGSYEFGVGYAEYERHRGYFELGYRNLWGLNRQGIFRTELSSLERRFILQYNEPWFFGSNLPLRVMFLHEQKKEITIPGRKLRYQLQRSTFSAGIEKKLTERVKGELYYDFSLVKTTNVQPDVVLSREDLGTLAISSVRTSLVYDTRDNPFEPRKGIFAGISLKVASPLLFSESHFAKVTLYANHYRQLHQRVVLALSAQGGIAYGFGQTTELPIVERFFLGGRSSVRGYEQDTLGPRGSDGNPTGGNAYGMGSIEFRTSIGRGISLVPFFDFGNVWVNPGDFAGIDVRYTAGIGFRYATPVGPLRVDYGVKLKKEPGQSGGELHFSVGHAF